MDVNARVVDRDVSTKSINRESNNSTLSDIPHAHSCSGVSLAAASLSGMINFINPDFVAASWQTYLFYVAMAFVTGKAIHCHELLDFLTTKHIP